MRPRLAEAGAEVGGMPDAKPLYEPDELRALSVIASPSSSVVLPLLSPLDAPSVSSPVLGGEVERSTAASRLSLMCREDAPVVRRVVRNEPFRRRLTRGLFCCDCGSFACGGSRVGRCSSREVRTKGMRERRRFVRGRPSSMYACVFT
jgi:hypothetical protein